MAKKKQPAGKKAPEKAKKAPVKTKKAPAKAKKTTPEPKKTPAQTKKTFSVAEFSEMTYLTIKGVNGWLKQGKLQGEKDEKGNWLVNAASLQLPFMKRLIR